MQQELLLNINMYNLQDEKQLFAKYKKKNKVHFLVNMAPPGKAEGLIEDMNLLKQLIDQVYQFSLMYWKSTNQLNLLVTIKYPEMVAEIFPHFEHNHLPEFGKENLWFL
jgi:hypothetical protein